MARRSKNKIYEQINCPECNSIMEFLFSSQHKTKNIKMHRYECTDCAVQYGCVDGEIYQRFEQKGSKKQREVNLGNGVRLIRGRCQGLSD